MNANQKTADTEGTAAYRVVTRPDFDGIVCAVLICDALDIRTPVTWVEPNQMQNGLFKVKSSDIIANLPYNPDCAMWFDHHYSNKIETPFQGAYRIAPSAAGIVYDYFKGRLKRDYSELVEAADKIDAAELSYDEVVYPERYPYILLSMTLSRHDPAEEPYWQQLVKLFGKSDVDTIMKLPDIHERCREVIEANTKYKELLITYTEVREHVSITDFRSFDPAPTGNRFLVYSLFPETVVSMKIRYDDLDREKVIVSIGHSIFNRQCRVNVGKMLTEFNGGGHKGAGACSFHYRHADDYIPQLIDILLKNEPNDEIIH